MNGQVCKGLGLLLATLTCCIALSVPGAAPLASAAGGSGLLQGINIAGLRYGASLASASSSIVAAHQLHARVVRLAVPWSVMEPSAPNQIDPRAQAFLDRVVNDAAADGMKVIMTADSTPCWASSAPPSMLAKCVSSKDSEADAWPPSNPDSYAPFVAYLAGRYGPHLAAIEVWNEPDQVNQFYFAGPEKARRYAAILRAAYPAIKRADPAVPVLAGSLVGSNGAFLKALYAAGIEGYYNGLAVHYYNLTLASVRAIHETQLANGDQTPLWLNEFGWSSCWPRHRIQQEQACVTAKVQAANLANMLRSLESAPYIAAAVVYGLQDNIDEQFGALTSNGARKPSFAALAHEFSSPSHNPSRVTLALTRKSGRILASGSGPVGDYMNMEAWVHGTLRYRVLFALDRFNHYSIALPRVLGTSGLRVRVFQYWQGLSRAVQRTI
jgi:Cellulase (glycosyl hydrolase family 5)